MAGFQGQSPWIKSAHLVGEMIISSLFPGLSTHLFEVLRLMSSFERWRPTQVKDLAGRKRYFLTVQGHFGRITDVL